MLALVLMLLSKLGEFLLTPIGFSSDSGRCPEFDAILLGDDDGVFLEIRSG